jgi:hypothetical protein
MEKNSIIEINCHAKNGARHLPDNWMVPNTFPVKEFDCPVVCMYSPISGVRLELCSLANYLCCLLAELEISLNDTIIQIDLEKANHQQVEELIQNNHLGIRKMGIFSLKRNAKDFFLSLQWARGNGLLY